MLSWLKRLLERVRFAVRVVLAFLIVIAPPLITLYVALRCDASAWLSFVLAVCVDPALLLLWALCKGSGWVAARVSGFFWKFRSVRRAVFIVSALAAIAVAGWNITHMGDDAWIFIACEAVGTTALALAVFLSGERTRLETRARKAFGQQWSGRFGKLRVIVWLAAIVVIDLWLYAVVESLLGGNWIVIPLGWFEHLQVSLAAIPPVVFTCAALLARPPYLRRSAPRWVFAFEKVTPEQRERIRRVFRVVPSRIFGRKLKVVAVTDADGQKHEVGERFVFGRMLCVSVALCTLLSVVALSVFADWFLPSVPSDLSSAEKYQPVVSTVVHDRHGQVLCNFSLENRIWVSLDNVPKHVQDAFVAAEDKNFWMHDGIDPQGIIRAGVNNFQRGHVRQGASTLTQQVIKQIVLKDSSRNWRRKASEIILAVRFEKQMTAIYGHPAAKKKILEIYLNHVYLGKNAYGIEAAAETYFGKNVKALTLAEAAMLAGLPKAPSLDSPDGHFDRAKDRQRYVLGRMVDTGAITATMHDEANEEPIGKIERARPFNLVTAPYACEEVRKFAERKFGYDAVYKQGLVIETTFDLELQRKAQASVRYGLLDLERRLGFAGPEGHDKDAAHRCDGPAEWVADEALEANARVIVRDRSSITVCVRGNAFPLDPDDVMRVVKWERAKPGRALIMGDLLTVRVESRMDAKGKTQRFALTARRTPAGKDHPAALQAALVAIDPQSGEIRAIVGGYDWNENQYNNATQAKRQTGSSIKPYVYLTALENGETVASTVLDAPICLPTASGTWCPTNYSGPNTRTVYYGTVDLVTALAKSLNSVSVRLAVDVGLDKIIGAMRSLGIRSKIVRVFPLAVGTPELTLREHTAGYAQILSNGRAMAMQGYGEDQERPGIFVKEAKAYMRGLDGKTILHTIYTAPARPLAQAAPSGDAYAMTHLMRGVVEFGTGTRAKRLRRPVAGKTGTTNSFRDVWFMGGTADLVVGTWVGRTNPQPIAKEATGGVVALPIWEAFMEAAFPVPSDGKSFATPPRDFPIPDDVTLIRRGQTEDGRSALLPFQRGKMPSTYLQAPEADFGHGSFE